MKTLLPLAAFALTAASAHAAVVSSVNYHAYSDTAQGLDTISPFSATFGPITDQDPNGTTGETDISVHDFRGLTATVVTPGDTYFFLEDFSDGQFDVPGVTFTPTNMEIRTHDGRNGSASKGNNTDNIDEDDGAVDNAIGNPRGAIRFPNRFDFNAAALGGQLPTYAGLALAGDDAGITINAFNISGDLLGTSTALHDGGKTAFVGVIATEGIAYVTFDTPAEADHFQYGYLAVPEPSSTALLGLGGLALILRRRK